MLPFHYPSVLLFPKCASVLCVSLCEYFVCNWIHTSSCQWLKDNASTPRTFIEFANEVDEFVVSFEFCFLFLFLFLNRNSLATNIIKQKDELVYTYTQTHINPYNFKITYHHIKAFLNPFISCLWYLHVHILIQFISLFFTVSLYIFCYLSYPFYI